MSNESFSLKIWRVISPIVVHIVVYALILFGSSLIISAQYSNTDDYNNAMNSNAALFSSIAAAVTIIILYIFYKRDNVLQSEYIFKHPEYIFYIFLLAVTLCHGLSLLISLFVNEQMIQSYQQVENNLFEAGTIIAIIRAVILAPLCEELIFRGLMFRRLREYKGFYAGAIISSVVFAVYHLNLAQGIYALFLGFVLCLVYDKTKNLWAGIILHAVGNLLSIILTVTGVSYNSDILYYIVMTTFLVAAISLCLFIFKPLSVSKD